MANANLDFSGLSVTRTFTFPDATGTIALTTGSSSIVTVGTITTGVWHGTKIGLLYGGTNADLSGTGGAHQFLRQNSSGATIDVVQPALADLSDASTIALNSSFNFDDPGIASASSSDIIGCGGNQLFSQTAIRGAGGTLAALTLNFADGIINSIATITTTRVVTALTVTGNVNLDATRTVLATPSALTANQTMIWAWDGSSTPACWIRMQ